MSENSVDKDATATAVENTPVKDESVKAALEAVEAAVKPPTACGLNITEKVKEMNNIMLEGARLGIQAAVW